MILSGEYDTRPSGTLATVGVGRTEEHWETWKVDGKDDHENNSRTQLDNFA